MPTSVMTMTEMPQGRQIRGSPKNLLASSNPSKLDCRHHTTIIAARHTALAALTSSRCLTQVSYTGAQQQQQRQQQRQQQQQQQQKFGASKDVGSICEQMLKVEGNCTCIPVSKLMQRATGTLSEPDTLKQAM